MVWPAFVTLIAVLSAQVMVSLPFGVAMGFLFARQGGRLDRGLALPDLAQKFPGLTAAMFCASAVSTVAVAAGALWLARKQWPVPVLARSAVRPPALLVAALVLAFFAMGSVSTWLGIRTGHFESSMLAVFRRLSAELPLPAFAAMALAASLGAGFAEEVIFRGVLQRHFIARWDVASGIMLSSLLFALIHFDLVQSSFAFCVGLVAGWAAWRSGTLWPGMVAHVLNNATSFTMSRLLTDHSSKAEIDALAIPVGLLALALGTIAWLSRRSPR